MSYYIPLTKKEKDNFHQKTSMLNLKDLKYLHYELTLKILNNQNELDNRLDNRTDVTSKEINY